MNKTLNYVPLVGLFEFSTLILDFSLALWWIDNYFPAFDIICYNFNIVFTSIALEGYLFVLETLRHEIGGASKRVQQLTEDDQDSMLLMTIPGVGYYSALLIKSEIGDVKRFPSAKQLCSYAGLVPSTHASGNVCYHGHITKQGSRWLRWILIEAAIHAVKRPGALRRFYFKVERKKGGQIAKVATARKLLEWICDILKDGKSFREVEKVAEAMGKGEPVNSSGNV